MHNPYCTEVSNFRGFHFIYFLGVGQIFKMEKVCFLSYTLYAIKCAWVI